MAATYFFSFVLITFATADPCDDSKLKRMFECAEKNKIVHLTTFQCYEDNTQGPCMDGELFVLDEFDLCNTPKCIDHGGCKEDQLLYEDQCYSITKQDLIAPCNDDDTDEVDPSTRILFSDEYGNVTCRSLQDFQYIGDTRSVFDRDIVPFVKTVKLNQQIATFKEIRLSLCSLSLEYPNSELKQICSIE